MPAADAAGYGKDAAARSGMQEDGSLEGFGEDPAAIAPHFTQTVQRPPIESGGDSKEVLLSHPPGKAKRHHFKVKLDDTQQQNRLDLENSCRDTIF